MTSSHLTSEPSASAKTAPRDQDSPRTEFGAPLASEAEWGGACYRPTPMGGASLTTDGRAREFMRPLHAAKWGRKMLEGLFRGQTLAALVASVSAGQRPPLSVSRLRDAAGHDHGRN